MCGEVLKGKKTVSMLRLTNTNMLPNNGPHPEGGVMLLHPGQTVGLNMCW